MDLVLSDLPTQERYKFLTALVIPRPVALVTSRNEQGLHNAAPFSFFNVFSEDPAMVVLGFSVKPNGGPKDTVTNIRKTGVFVVNMVDHRVIDAMHVCSSDVPSDESEIDYAGVTLEPSRLVDVQRIAQAPVSLECRLFQLTNVSERRALVMGEVLCVHVLDEIIDPATRRVIPERYSPIARLYGDHYAWLGERYSKAIPTFEDLKTHGPDAGKVGVGTRSR
jgi:flavin reductase (DIM6/NTAB) family NADH-FMN oxidoreductase RutF